MMGKVKEQLLFFIYISGLMLVSAELLLNFLGSSFCFTEGCRVVESFVRGGDLTLLLIGMVVFGSLIIVYKLGQKGRVYFVSDTLILFIALTVEGYLVGFQFFVLKQFCVFCLTVFALLATAMLLKAFSGSRLAIYAFANFFAVFIATYLVGIQLETLPNSKYVLIYSKFCPHCKEVLQYCEQKDIEIDKVEISKAIPVMRALNIKQVPVLICQENDSKNKEIVVGVNQIKDFFEKTVYGESISVNSVNKKIVKQSEKKTENKINQENLSFCPIFEMNCQEKRHF